ncbi:MAG: PKD domain-containing protein, partial [Euryarchaeota archaeon]|nr:PKD domain-containing protein [Euryarchaeota archaeon]
YPHANQIRTVEVYTLTQRNKKELLQDRVSFAPPEKVELAPLQVVTLATFSPTPEPTTIEVIQEDANLLIPIAADFSSDVRIGDPPLTVQFWDLSRGAPSQYLWNFGDGMTSDQKNPIHTYFVPGSYDVSLRASNQYHTDYKEIEGFITIGSPPVAEFFADPTDGYAPLTVVFTDLSTGSPRNWEWSFGDGAAASEKNPFHIYQNPGVYTVGLIVTNAYGASKEIKDEYITIRSPTLHDVFLSESRTGYLVDEGSITLRVLQGPSFVKIAGRNVDFEVGDIVQFIVNDGSQGGQIYIINNALHDFQFADVTLIVNNIFIARGSINSVRIGGFDSYKSTLAIRIPAGDQYTSLFIDSQPIGSTTTPQMVLLSLGPDSTGKMSYKKSVNALNYQGGIGSYQIA